MITSHMRQPSYDLRHNIRLGNQMDAVHVSIGVYFVVILVTPTTTTINVQTIFIKDNEEIYHHV